MFHFPCKSIIYDFMNIIKTCKLIKVTGLSCCSVFLVFFFTFEIN